MYCKFILLNWSKIDVNHNMYVYYIKQLLNTDTKYIYTLICKLNTYIRPRM